MAIFFLFITLSIIGLAHYAVYGFIVRFFAMEAAGLKYGLAVGLAVLSVSIILTMLLARLVGGRISAFLYFLSGLWYGILINLLMAIGLAWLVFGFIRLAGYNPALWPFGLAAVILAMGISVYGIFNAVDPAVNRVSLSLDGLPGEWRGKTVVQLSDVHLGRILGPDYLTRLVERVNALEPDLVLITGDLFDGASGDLSEFVGPLNRLAAGAGVYFVSGNHEIYSGMDKCLAALSQTGINILDNRVVNIDGLQIIGIGYPHSGQERDVTALIRAQENYDPGAPTILLYHMPTNIAPPDNGSGNWHRNMYWSPDTDLSAARKLGADLQLSGHTHRGQIFPFNLLTRWMYRGYDYGLHEEGDFQIYITSGTGVWGPTMRTGSRSEIAVFKLR